MKKENLIITGFLAVAVVAVAIYLYTTRKTGQIITLRNVTAPDGTQKTEEVIWYTYKVVGENVEEPGQGEIWASEANQIKANLAGNDINEGDFYEQNKLALFRNFAANDVITIPDYVLN